jgi:hypothetical protein
MIPAIRRPFLRALALCAVLCALGASAHAQFLTEVKLNKGTYLTYEAVEVTVTIANRSGADVVMGGPNGQAWLIFEVTDPAGNRVPALRLRTDETLVFKAGANISRKIFVSDYHSFSEYGIYSITAGVYHPPSQQYFSSNRARATFTDTRPFWGKDKPFGVPLGLPGAGQIRHYELSVLRDTEHTHLYVRLIDDKTGLKIATFSLGTCIMISDPQIALDRDNMLHVLFMTLPHTYAHTTVDTQGRVIKTTYHKEIKTDRPQLVVAGNQSIGVQGGVVFDPAAAAAAAAPVKGRSIGAKPPGL